MCSSAPENQKETKLSQLKIDEDVDLLNKTINSSEEEKEDLVIKEPTEEVTGNKLVSSSIIPCTPLSGSDRLGSDSHYFEQLEISQHLKCFQRFSKKYSVVLYICGTTI